MPKYPLETVADWYTHFVDIVGISETVFFEEDIDFVFRVSENKAAHTNWLNYAQERMSNHGRKK